MKLQSLALPVVWQRRLPSTQTQLPSVQSSRCTTSLRLHRAWRSILSHIPRYKIKGFPVKRYPALEGADVVLISAGVARKPRHGSFRPV